jgi:hypothetical protein
MQVPNVDVNRPPAVRNSSAANVTVPDSRLVTPKLPAPGRGAATILDKLNVPKLDRAKADAYVAAEAGRLGISDAQLAAEAVRSQGIVVTGKALAAAAGLEPLAGNDALRRGLQHLGSSRRVPAAANAAPGADDIALRWKEANDRRERAQAEGARQKQRDLEARIAQAASLPPRPPDAPGPRANMPMRYLVAGDTEYLQRIMGPTPFVPTQVYVEAAKVNRLVDSMLGVRPLPRGFYEPPVRLGPNMEILDGHNRLVAATIVSARTGRPVFESWGPNAILRDPGAPLPAGARQPRGGGWMLKVKP